MVDNQAHSNPQKSYKPRVLLVFRRYTSSFLGYAWMLGRGGQLTLDAISLSDHLIAHSSWIDRHIKVEHSEDFLDTLCATLAKGGYDEMLCIDEPARTLVLSALDRPELKAYQPFKRTPVLSSVAINKIEFNDWCESIGLSIPRSINCYSSVAVRAASETLGYPFVLKESQGSGGQQVHVVSDQAMLEAILSECKNASEWIAQEYLAGQVGTAMFVARGGRLYAHCSVENIACTAGGVGPTALCRYLEDPALVEIVRKIALHVDGITGFDWIARGDGSYALIDPHFGRVAPTAVCTHLFGVDFGAAYSASLLDQDAPASGSRLCEVVWVFPQLLQLVFQGGLRAAWSRANPLGDDVKIHMCGRGECQMCFLQLLYYLLGQFQVFAGRWRRWLTSSGRSGRAD